MNRTTAVDEIASALLVPDEAENKDATA